MTGKSTARYFLFVLMAGAVLLAFSIFKPFIAPLSLAAVFAVVLQPLYRRMLETFSPWNSIASLVTVLISVVCLMLPLTFITSMVVREARQVYSSTESTASTLDFALSSLDEFISPLVPGISSIREQVSANLDTYTKQSVEWMVEHVATAFTSVASILLDLFIFVVALYYFLRDGEKFKNAIKGVSPLSSRDEELIFSKLAAGINSVVRGSLLIALIQGVLSTIGLSIFGVPNSVLWGSVAFFAALIPGIGTALVILPAIGYLILVGPISSAIGLTIWGVLGVGTVDNFLGPKLVSRGLKMHPLVILPAVLGGILFFGPAGIFLGPLSLSLLFTLISIQAEDKIEDTL